MSMANQNKCSKSLWKLRTACQDAQVAERLRYGVGVDARTRVPLRPLPAQMAWSGGQG